MQTITRQELISLFRHLADFIEAEKQHLNELDAEIGDGDMGVTLACGFQAIKEASQRWDDLDCGQILRECGMAMANSAAGTIGTLLASALMSAGKQVVGKGELNREDIVKLLQAMYEAIQKRGRAQIGDKTMLDVFYPAYLAAQKAVAEDHTLESVLKTCAEAATTGAEATRAMVGRQGRALWFQERSVGVVDPGAKAVAMIFHAGTNYLCDNIKKKCGLIAT
jgi:phosphoenolpyruvate---glycerone phosphotransferase subunit DhaL